MVTTAISTGSQPKHMRADAQALVALGLLLAAFAMACDAGLPTQPKLLPPEQAFRLSAAGARPIARSRRASTSPTATTCTGTSIAIHLDPDRRAIALRVLPPGQGQGRRSSSAKVETYRGDVVMRVPLAAPAPGQSARARADSQGCADAGVCYPPNAQEVHVAMPATGGKPGPFVEASAAGRAGSSELSPRSRQSIQGRPPPTLPRRGTVTPAGIRHRVGVSGRGGLAGGVALPRAVATAPAMAQPCSPRCFPTSPARSSRLDQWRGKVCGRELLGDVVRAVPRGNAANLPLPNSRDGCQRAAICRHRRRSGRQSPRISSKEIGLNYPALIGGFGAMELSKALGNELWRCHSPLCSIAKGENVAHTQLGRTQGARTGQTARVDHRADGLGRLLHAKPPAVRGGDSPLHAAISAIVPRCCMDNLPSSASNFAALHTG